MNNEEELIERLKEGIPIIVGNKVIVVRFQFYDEFAPIELQLEIVVGRNKIREFTAKQIENLINVLQRVKELMEKRGYKESEEEIQKEIEKVGINEIKQ